MPKLWPPRVVRALCPGVLIMLSASFGKLLSLGATHLDEHRKLLGDFTRQLSKDPCAALKVAEKAVAESARLARDDPKRGDALELEALALMSTEQFPKMLAPAAELVRIRKAAQPPEPELLALALNQYAVALFANDRAAESDRAVADSLAAYRSAFSPTDIQLAQKLEAQAEFVQNNMGRKDLAIEMLKEAVDIRLRNPDSSGGKLAETVEQLVIYQLHRGDISEAETRLKQAEALLEAAIKRDPEREETKAGLAQVLVLRAGVADKLGQREAALALAKQVRRMQFQDRVLQTENELMIAGVLTNIYETAGDLERAAQEQASAVDVFRRNQDLLEKGDLDPLLLGDIYVDLAELETALHNLNEAAQFLKLGHDIHGDSEQVLFAKAKLAAASGDSAGALRAYQQALRLRKESAAEVSVFFATIRKNQSMPANHQPRFGNSVGGLSFGRSSVLVPGGQFNPEAWHKRKIEPALPVGWSTESEKLLIRKQQLLSPAELVAESSAVATRARLYPGAALVFIHGYNVPFEAAVQRAAQLVRDLNFDGPAFVFAWPSRGELLAYGKDRTMADESAESLAEFLAQLQQIKGVRTVHLVAHSMGNRVLLQSLLKSASTPVRPELGEIVLAAPAVPQDYCAEWLTLLNQLGLRRFTLYASKVDVAMWAALAFTERTVLAGHVKDGKPFTHPGVDTIDISEAGAAFELTHFELNHDVFATNPIMVEDMRQLLQNGIRPPDRRLSSLQPRNGYWFYHETAPPAPHPKTQPAGPVPASPSPCPSGR